MFFALSLFHIICLVHSTSLNLTTSVNAQNETLSYVPHPEDIYFVDLDTTISFRQFGAELSFSSASLLLNNARVSIYDDFHAHPNDPVPAGRWEDQLQDMMLRLDEVGPRTRSMPPLTYKIAANAMQALSIIWPLRSEGEGPPGHYFNSKFRIGVGLERGMPVYVASGYFGSRRWVLSSTQDEGSATNESSTLVTLES